MAAHEIENDIGHRTDLESFLMGEVTAGHKIESEDGLPFWHTQTSLSILWPAVT